MMRWLREVRETSELMRNNASRRCFEEKGNFMINSGEHRKQFYGLSDLHRIGHWNYPREHNPERFTPVSITTLSD